MTGHPRRGAFPAFGTTVELLIWGVSERETAELLERIRQQAERWEWTFSRFLPDSELNRVNRSCGHWVPVSCEFLHVVTAARDGYIATGGRFDPSILSSLERAGYDRPFAEMACHGGGRPMPPARPMPQSAGMLDFEIDDEVMAVRLPVGMRIDLGGIAKGAFVDSVDDLLRGCPGALLDAGGDIRVWGAPGSEGAWRVGVQHPGALEEDIARLELQAGASTAVATSSTRTRTWLTGAERQNHLIDPKERQPVPWSTPSVTVVAKNVTAAEIQAKSVLIAISRGEAIPYTTADLVLIAHEDGHYETITPYAAVA